MNCWTMPTRVAIIEDETVYREYLASLIKGTSDLKLAGSFSSVNDAWKPLTALDVDVLLLDLELGGASALDQLGDLKASMGDTRIVVLTTHTDDDRIFRSLKLGADGYLHKEATSAASLIDSIREASKGHSPISGSIARRIINDFKSRTPDVNHVSELTPRELECLKALAEGLTNKEIAAELAVMEGTVRVHVHNVLRKLHVRNRVEAGKMFWNLNR